MHTDLILGEEKMVSEPLVLAKYFSSKKVPFLICGCPSSDPLAFVIYSYSFNLKLSYFVLRSDQLHLLPPS